MGHAQAGRDLQQVKNSSVHIFEDSGHIPHLEFYNEFNRIVIEFIAKNQ